MNVNFETIFAHPDVHFHGFGPEDKLTFVPMNKAQFASAVALDQRLDPVEPKVYRVPADAVMAEYDRRGYRAPKLAYIHHTGLCGAQQVTNLLASDEEALVLREPLALSQVGTIGGAGFEMAQRQRNFGPMLGFALSMMGKRYGANQAVIVKGTVASSCAAEAIQKADPGRPTLFVTQTLEQHLVAHLRTPTDAERLAGHVRELRLAEREGFAEAASGSLPLQAAALWIAMIEQFQRVEDQNGSTRALAADTLFDQPAEVAKAAAKLFGTDADVDASAIEKVAKAKAPTRDEASRPAEFDKAIDWAKAKAGDLGLRSRFWAPLVGEATELF